MQQVHWEFCFSKPWQTVLYSCKANEFATPRKSYCIIRSTNIGPTPKIHRVDRLSSSILKFTWSVDESIVVGNATSVSLLITDLLSDQEVSFSEFPPNSTVLISPKLPAPIIDRVYRASVRLYYHNNSMSPTSKGDYSNSYWRTADDCNGVQYLDDSKDLEEWSCEPCPKGASCAGNIAWAGVKARFGYWRYKRRFYTCLSPQACLGAPNTDSAYSSYIDNYNRNESCNTHIVQGSRLCSTCAPGFARGKSPGSCIKCSGRTTDVVFLILYALLSALVTLILVRLTVFKPSSPNNFSTGVKKSIISYLQFAHLASELQIPWSSAFQRLFQYQAYSVSVGSAMVSLDCALAAYGTWAAFKMKVYISVILPVLCIPTSYLVMKIGKGDMVHFKASIVCLLYLLYPSLIAVFAKVFKCTVVDEVAYFTMDPEVVCWQNEHLNIAIVALVFSILYIVGLPLLGWWCIKN